MLIKLKCWNLELKEWDKCAYPLFDGMNPVEIIGFQDTNGNEQLIKDGNAVVLYSGLNDRDGMEIYEGDIVNVPYNHLGNVTVKFKDGCFNISKYNVSKLKVVGNVYEGVNV